MWKWGSVAALVAGAFFGAVAPAEAAFFGTNGKLVFQSPSGDGIYTVNPDQTELTKVYDEPPGPPIRALPTWSPDGSRIAFASRASGNSQIYTMDADGSDVQQVTSGSETHAPAWRPSGSEIAFVRTTPPSLRRIKPDGTVELQIGPAGLQATELAWGESRLAYTTDNGGQLDIYSINTSIIEPPVNLTANNPLTDDTSPEWKPDFDTSADELVFRTLRDAGAGLESTLYRMAPNGTGQTPLVTGHDAVFPAWAPARTLLAFSDGAGMLNLATDDGADVVSLGIAGVTPDWQPVPLDTTPPSTPTGLTAVAGDETVTLDWDDHPEAGVTYSVLRASPCGTTSGGLYPFLHESSLFLQLPNGFEFCFRVRASDTAGNESEWSEEVTATPTPTPYPRPAGATPLRVSLVPAVDTCQSPNRVHGPPLEHPSCAPPQPSSSNLTVGGTGGSSPAAAAARSIGFARLTVLGTLGDPEDSDVRVAVSITNVMKASDLSEYDGELRAVLGLRITDRLNSYWGTTGSGTVSDSGFGFSLPCIPTPETSVKSTCAVVTSADAIAPGSVPEGARAVWQLEEVELFDGGPDDDGDTLADNELFATQGVFVP